MGRGVLYMVWGDGYADALQRSIDSLKRWHPELPCVVRMMPPDSTVLCKSQMFELSPFEETLFLDADTVVMGNLDYGFSEAHAAGIACCISANPWQRRYDKLPSLLHRDATEHSSGVVFFDKSHECVARVFCYWEEADLDTSTRYARDDGVWVQRDNDQALFTLAMARENFRPMVLPQNWNLHPKWQKQFFGPVKILHGHCDSLQALESWNDEQSKEGAVIKPAQLL